MKKEKLENSINQFILWYKKNGENSFDRMDYWSSPLGILAKKTFYKNKIVGAPLAIIGLLLENFFPTIQKLFSKPHSEVIGDSHLALSFLNLYEDSNDIENLQEAERLIQKICSYSTKGFSGMCWGYTFGWQQSRDKFWPKSTPMITITPYAFWALKKHYELTNSEISKKRLLSIANFTLLDLNVTNL